MSNKTVSLRLIDLIVLKAAAKTILKIAKKDHEKALNIRRLEDAIERSEKIIKREKAK